MADTPSCALYAGLKSLGRINNGNAAQILMAGNARYGGRLISERLTVPSFISREIVHAKPGDLPRAAVCGPLNKVRARYSTSSCKTEAPDPQPLSKVAKRYMESCVPDCKDALTNCGVDGMLFRNGVERIETADDSDIKDHLYIPSGLFYRYRLPWRPRPRHRIHRVLCVRPDALDTRHGRDDRHLVFLDNRAPHGETFVWGAARRGNSARPPLRPFTRTRWAHYRVAARRRERHHRRRFRRLAPAPAYLAPRRTLACAGSRSTNGSFLISGVDRCRQAIEPPRRERPANFANTPVEIHNGDTLCLGATTRFLDHSHHRLARHTSSTHRCRLFASTHGK